MARLPDAEFRASNGDDPGSQFGLHLAERDGDFWKDARLPKTRTDRNPTPPAGVVNGPLP